MPGDEPGARHEVADNRTLRLLFVVAGEGTIGGSVLRRWSTVRLQPGEAAVLEASRRLEFFELRVRPVGKEPIRAAS